MFVNGGFFLGPNFEVVGEWIDKTGFGGKGFGGVRQDAVSLLRNDQVKKELGITDEQSYSGNALDTRWSDPHKRSAFVGTFTLSPQPSVTN